MKMLLIERGACWISPEGPGLVKCSLVGLPSPVAAPNHRKPFDRLVVSAAQVHTVLLRVRSVLPMMMCFIPSFMLLGIVPAIVSAVFNAFA